MCFDDRASPPIKPIAGGALDARDLTLTSADGTKFMAYAARAAKPSGAGMVILPDVRGLHRYYKELAERFAENGIDAIAIDYFARTAETDDRSESFDFQAHVPLTHPDTTNADVAAAVAYLRSEEGGNVQSVFAMGFCFGGQIASLQAASGQRFSGVIPFYGWPDGSPRRPFWPAPADRTREFTCPVLAIYGEADEGIPPEVRERYDRALDEAGIERETHVYEGAPHSFFDRRQTDFADASTDAWQKVLAFVRKHSK
jgi:carboxymethylenebutenolidase